MKKKDFVTLILSTIGGILFALGMCMALLPEWGAMRQGIVIGVVGSFVGSVVFSLIGFHAYGLVAELIVGVVGACLFIWLGRKLF